MTQKGQILISQAKMLTSENTRLEQINLELQDTLRHLEQHLTKTINENNSARKNYLSIIDGLRSEIKSSELKIKELQGLVKQHSERQKVNNFLAYNSKASAKDKPREIEDSSLLVERLLEENASLHQGNDDLRNSLAAVKKELLELSFSDKKLPETPKSDYFLEEFSKIHIGKLNGRISVEDETIQKLLLECRSPEKDIETDKTRVIKKHANKDNKEKAKSPSKIDSRSNLTPKSPNPQIQQRPNCECRLI